MPSVNNANLESSILATRLELLRPIPPGGLQTVFLVDEDQTARERLAAIVRSKGWLAVSIASVREYFELASSSTPTCVIMDLALVLLANIDISKAVRHRPESPIIFTSHRFDVSTTVIAIKAGAAGFLTKPLQEDLLTNAIQQAFEASRATLMLNNAARELHDRYEQLSARERQVMSLVVAGWLNKQIAAQLEISEITVKAHRGRTMRKMRAKSLAELVRMSMQLPPDSPNSRGRNLSWL